MMLVCRATHIFIPLTIITMMMVVAPFSSGFKCRSFSTTSSSHRHYQALTCVFVPQIPLHLRESHLGKIQRRSVPLHERTDLSEARAERRAGASHHRRSSHLSRRRETGGEGRCWDANVCESNEWRD